MSVMMNSEFACRLCRGLGEVMCSCCGSEVDCNGCDGTGWDKRRVDVDAFQAACRHMTGCTWEWIEGGVRLGRRSENETVAVANFVRLD